MNKIAYAVTKDENTYAMSADGEKYNLSRVIGDLNDYIDLGSLDRLRELAEADRNGRVFIGGVDLASGHDFTVSTRPINDAEKAMGVKP